MNNTANKTKLERLIDLINWENWQNEKTGKPWKVSEVLYCRLDWLKEQIDADEIDKDEAKDTIEMLQIFVEGIKDKDIKGV